MSPLYIVDNDHSGDCNQELLAAQVLPSLDLSIRPFPRLFSSAAFLPSKEMKTDFNTKIYETIEDVSGLTTSFQPRQVTEPIRGSGTTKWPFSSRMVLSSTTSKTFWLRIGKMRMWKNLAIVCFLTEVVPLAHFGFNFSWSHHDVLLLHLRG